MIALAASLFVGLTEIYARSIRVPVADAKQPFRERRREAGPRLGAFVKFVGQVGLVWVIALGGRKILRIRLRD